MDILLFLLFSSLFFLLRNHLPKGSVCISVSCVKKKSSGALSHLFQSIAFELILSGRFVKEKPRVSKCLTESEGVKE